MLSKLSKRGFFLKVNTKRKLIQAVSKTVAESLGIEIDRIHVVLNEVSKDNWGMKGEQASEL